MLIISGICFAIIVVLALIGENILPLYGGDIELAARGSKASFALFGGCAFAFVQPAIWTGFTRSLQKVMKNSGNRSSMAGWLLGSNFVAHVRFAAFVFCWMGVFATLVLSVSLWQGWLV